MPNNIFSKLSKYLPWIIFGLVFLIFLIPVLNLRLFLDDHVLVFPALTHTYIKDFLNYTYGFGLYRPFRLVFLYYPLYTIYSFAPWFPFLLMFSVHLATGALIYATFKKYTEEKFSLLLGLSYVAFPFFTEQYAWIATGTTFVNFIVFLQIYIALISNLNLRKKLIWLFVLQLIGAFTYDTIFFNFILLGFLIYTKRLDWNLSKKQVAGFTALLAVPSVLYAFLRSFVLYPHNPETLREIKVSDLHNIVPIQLHNLSVFLSSQQFLFLGQGSWISFWQKTFVDGFNSLVHNPIPLLVLNYLIIAVVIFLLKKRKVESPDQTSNMIPVILILIAVLSLAPAFLVTIPSFPFRVIALSAWAVMAVVLFYLKHYSKVLGYFASVVVIFLGIIFSIQMLNGMRMVYNDDDRMSTEIVQALDQHMKKGQKATVVLQGMPFSTNTVYNYGEYLASCVHTDWCVQMELAKKTDKVGKVIVNPTAPVQEKGLVQYFRHNPDTKMLIYVK